jgi:hypothetical protein
MAVTYGSKTVTDGLVLYLDSGNPKSYNPNLVTTLGAFNYPFNGQSIGTQLDTAPDGSVVLCKHDFTGASGPFMNVRANRSLLAGTYTISAWFKGTTAFSANFALVGETVFEAPSQSINITTQWQRFSVSVTLANNQTASRVQLFFSAQGDNKIVSVWGVELVRGSTSTPAYINSNIRGVDWVGISGQSNTVNGLPSYVSDNNGSIIFDGTDDFITVPNSSALQIADTFTVNTWIYPTNLSSRHGIFSTRLLNTTGCWQLEIGTATGSGVGRVAVTGIGTWIFESGDNAVTINRWNNVCFVKPNNATQGGTLYVNGVQINPILTTAYTIANNNDNKVIAQGTGSGQYFSGRIGLTSLYNTALTASQVFQNFSTLRGRYGI